MESNESSQTPTERANAPAARRWRLTVAAAVLLAAAGVALWLWKPWAPRPLLPPAVELPPDPRLTFASSYGNIRPHVQYVGDARCATCHLDIVDKFKHHPMGQALGPVKDFFRIEDYTKKTGFESNGFHYEVKERDGKIFHREIKKDAKGEAVYEHEEEVSFVLGSGTRGRSYLINRDGVLFQSPISWYSQKEIWDLSPGYQKKNRHFERPIFKECLFCHSNWVEPVPDSVNKFSGDIFKGYAIGCERCHGPGELHVQLREKGEVVPKPDTTIVNPTRLAPLLREAVCEQCHLQGEMRTVRHGRDVFEFRPGMPLHLFQTTFLPPADVFNKHAVGHPEQMKVSECYKKSKGAMSCISCHDPHDVPSPADKAHFYRDRCLSCHGAGATTCSAPPAQRQKTTPADYCIQCHMPRFSSSDIVHTSVTDHRVPRKPEPTDGPALAPQGPPKLVPFHRDPAEPLDPALERDLGVAMAFQGPQNPLMSQLALPLLNPHLVRWPHDTRALGAKALALLRDRQEREALKLLEQILEMLPRHESTLAAVASLYGILGEPKKALPYWKRVLEINPQASDHHYGLALDHYRLKDWQKSAESCGAALRLNPARLDARRLLVQSYVELGARDDAQKELARYAAFRPPDLFDVQRFVRKKFP
ncbi:MAG: tetratricopeptide repeat protein [Gemmataceae bacterium]|nr:tetratricopeptide repeat protein [Gemmataceae bacterium]